MPRSRKLKQTHILLLLLSKCPAGFIYFTLRRRLYLTDESGGGALPDPETELPLLPLPQISFCAGGDKHRVLVYQWLMKNLEVHRGFSKC